MSRQQTIQHYARLLTRWPTDRLRPEHPHFQQLLRKRLQAAPSSHANEAREVNAAYLLIDNAFAKQYPLSENVMKPTSAPTHYTDLERELDEAPDRTWWDGVVKRVKGLVRLR
ncbi:hypothetical protein LTR36_007544 [Oleoguttula mirabilis]|uniref:Complex 1 LYR protein n=1 Tax=Oleoguttula mirabilis TaxID=1507867 RepID=A0AAV9JTQ3_9PEZI|nr:hypothetical protein LTR36_007544 [Oleoguttula mirabilis]